MGIEGSGLGLGLGLKFMYALHNVTVLVIPSSCGIFVCYITSSVNRQNEPNPVL